MNATASQPLEAGWRCGLPPQLVLALEGSKIPTLDGLRAIAAWTVVAYHLGLCGFGSQAVEFFFVLSGFLITWLLMLEQERHGAVSLRQFYLRRSLRIFPPFYVYWLASVAAVSLLNGPLPWGVLLSSLAYVSNWYQAWWGVPASAVSHCWSLALEEQYYLVWPLIFVGLQKHGDRRLTLTALLILAVWARRVACLYHGVPEHYIYHALDTRADQVLVGSWTAIALHRGRLHGLLNWLSRNAWLLPLTLAALAWQLQRDNLHGWRGLLGLGFWLEPLLFMLVLLQTVIHNRHAAVRWLDWRVLRWLGMLSYSTYLWHQLPVAGARYKLADLAPVVRIPLLVCVVLALSVLSFYLVERPAQRLKQRLMAHPEAMRGIKAPSPL